MVATTALCVIEQFGVGSYPPYLDSDTNRVVTAPGFFSVTMSETCAFMPTFSR